MRKYRSDRKCPARTCSSIRQFVAAITRTFARLNRSAPSAAIAALLQEAQQLCLVSQRESINLVEEQGSALRHRGQPLLVGMRISKSAAPMSEKFVLGDVLRKSRAVYRNKRTVAPLTQRMDCVREQFLSGSGFSGDQYWSVAESEALDLVECIKKNRMLANQLCQHTLVRKRLRLVLAPLLIRLSKKFPDSQV